MTPETTTAILIALLVLNIVADVLLARMLFAVRAQVVTALAPERPEDTTDAEHTAAVAQVRADLPPAPTGTPLPVAGYTQHSPVADRPLNRLLAPPPLVGRDTLRDWLIHTHQKSNVWSEVVTEFYDRAASVPFVWDYFGSVTDRARLERHFLAMLVVLTHTGVTERMVKSLADNHAGVRNSHGQPITPEVWSAVVSTLVEVLWSKGVPERTLTQLGVTVTPLREALVTERPSPEG